MQAIRSRGLKGKLVNPPVLLEVMRWWSCSLMLLACRKPPVYDCRSISAEDCDWTAAQERAAIALNQSGDFRCLNRAPGGASRDYNRSCFSLLL